MSWKDTSVSVSRIDAIWDKEDVFTCLNGQTGHETAVKQATAVVHGATHTSKAI